MSKKQTIVFVSSLVHSWGGSEELWKKSALILKRLGYNIVVFKENVNYKTPAIKDLLLAGIKINELGYTTTSTLQKIFKKVDQAFKKCLMAFRRTLLKKDTYHYSFKKYIKKLNPDLVIVAQSMNFDGIQYAAECFSLGIQYAIICQKAVETRWLLPPERSISIKAFEQAKACFFVSKHNLNLTEEQLGIRLSNAKIVFNPIKVNRKIIPMPTSSVVSFACIGRLCILDKGQDILLRILAKPNWRNREFTLSFIGSGDDEEGLRAMVKLLDLKNINFIAHIEDIENLWKEYHALLLPSRFEGLPLAVMEAMAVGRTVITTNAGGNIEVIENEVSGFIGEATENAFAMTMENAWSKKQQWESIGLNAFNYINNNVPILPEEDFCSHLIYLLND